MLLIFKFRTSLTKNHIFFNNVVINLLVAAAKAKLMLLTTDYLSTQFQNRITKDNLKQNRIFSYVTNNYLTTVTLTVTQIYINN